MDNQRRSILKALSYRIVASLQTFVISYLLTSEVAVASGIALGDFFSKFLTYYIHERIWNKVPI